jgi:hypothetical protein
MRHDRARGSLDRHATYKALPTSLELPGNGHRLEQPCLAAVGLAAG